MGHSTTPTGRRELARRPGCAPLPDETRLPKLNGHDLYEVTVSELQQHLSQHHFTSAEYVTHCINYIEKLNPHLSSIIELNPDAVSIAHHLDEERASSKTRGPLHGIPILVKDNIATRDSVETTCGSLALKGSVVKDDAFVVKRLRAAGAVILGHSNMCEWASLRKQTSAGYSPRGGQTRNPYNLRNTPWGSSGGSATSVSANLVPLAIGTESDTSIISPAAANAIVGIKPTVGMTSRTGVIPISENLDTVGTFGRTVADAVVALDAIVGRDGSDPFTMVPEREQPESFMEYLSTKDRLKGAKFGVPIKGCWENVPPDCKELAEEVLNAMKCAGAEIVEVNFPSVGDRVGENGMWDWKHGTPETSEWTVAKVDAYNGINDYLKNFLLRSRVRSLEDIAEYNEKNTVEEGGVPGTVNGFPDGQPSLLEVIETKGKKDDVYHAALRHIQKQTRENGIDAGLKYTNPATGKTTQLDGLVFCDRNGIGQQYAAQAGYPIICIPIGLDDKGMPVGLSLQHTAWKDAELVAWASAIEDLWNGERGWRALPRFENLHADNFPVEKY